jgi:hypothetical protein
MVSTREQLADQHRPEVYRTICVVRTAVCNSSSALAMTKVYRVRAKETEDQEQSADWEHIYVGRWECGREETSGRSIRGCSRPSHKVPGRYAIQSIACYKTIDRFRKKYRRLSSGKSGVRFYAIVYNLRASVELQSAQCASKRFGAIPPGHFFTNALRLKCSVYGSSPMRSPKVLCSVPLNKSVLIPSTSVIHSA